MQGSKMHGSHMQSGLASLRLFQLISPSLPVGAFTYSQAMEWAIECGWIKDRETLSDWLKNILLDSFIWLELPVLIRLHNASSSRDDVSFLKWSQYLYASRETSELRQEETNRARALLLVLTKLPENPAWPELVQWRDALLKSQAAGFALAAHQWNIEQQQMLLGYVWSWLENAVTVGIKLVPLGQSDGQAILHRLSKQLPSMLEKAKRVKDEDVGAGTTALAIASSLHETQYTRLFRS